MAIRYEEWLKATGKPPTEANALIWKKTHGVALGLYNPDGSPKGAAAPAPAPGPAPEAGPAAPPAPAPYVPPAYDPNYRDAQAIGEESALNAKWDTARNNARTSYATWLTDMYGAGAAVKGADGKWTYDLTKRGGKIGEIDYNEREDTRKNTNQLAARHALRSGIRVADEDRIGVAAGQQRAEVGRQQNQQFTTMSNALGEADTEQSLGRYQIGVSANQRRLDDYNRRYGMGS